ncbi:hypothetical protein [Janibacter sp. GXQ6167]|uniref:hypothetical protein n=1 Tax=Janibacter sp. GXQ6167 TaxID=3240791 RepID=UPI003524146B
MSNPTPQEALQAMQAQALDAIKSGQAAALDAVKKWNADMAQFRAAMPPAPEMPEEVRQSMGDPEQMVDSAYDFAAKLLELNKQFVHQLLEASTPKQG